MMIEYDRSKQLAPFGFVVGPDELGLAAVTDSGIQEVYHRQ
jgi:hypothetical protein